MSTTFHGSSVSLRPTGVLRYFGAAFLMVWLTGWAFGEVFAAGFLVLLLRSIAGSAIGAEWPIPGGEWIAGGAAGFVLLFLVFWLTLWTIGGLAALRELLRSVAGEDSVAVESAGVELQHRAGPFRRTRQFDRSQIRRVRMRSNDRAVVLDTRVGTQVVTKFGSLDERKAMTEWLRARLLLPDAGTGVDPSAAPPGWRLTTEGGATRLTQDDRRARAVAAAITWFMTLLLLMMVVGADGSVIGRVLTTLLMLAMAAGAIWLTFARSAWIVRHGQLTAQTRFLTWERVRQFNSGRLEVVRSTDSDNDEHYRLNVANDQGTRRIASEMRDAAAIVDLGRWLSARTGFQLVLPHQLR